MKKTLQKIRAQSREVRMTIAFVLALVSTLIIGAGWFMTFSLSRTTPQTKPPSPFSALAGSIKDVVGTSPKDTTTQIIDTGAADVLYDESNPYQQ